MLIRAEFANFKQVTLESTGANGFTVFVNDEPFWFDNRKAAETFYSRQVQADERRLTAAA